MPEVLRACGYPEQDCSPGSNRQYHVQLHTVHCPPQDAAHKVLGVFMILMGSYREHKEYVLAKMKKRCKAMAEDDVIPRRRIKELAVTMQSPAVLYQYYARKYARKCQKICRNMQENM